jgi:hypothetical protein
MNVQLTAATERSRKQTAERSQTVTMPQVPATRARMDARLSLSTDHQQKCLASGVFCLLVGWIVANSDWSAQPLGFPMMLVGLILPLMPVIAWHRLSWEAQRAQVALAVSEAEIRKRTGRAMVYELHSGNYTAV